MRRDVWCECDPLARTGGEQAEDSVTLLMTFTVSLRRGLGRAITCIANGNAAIKESKKPCRHTFRYR
jgi:hypothetical protein